MGYLKNIKKQYIINLFRSLIPAYVIERLFWQQRGLNVQMVVYCEIIYALTITLLEIPSGILADRFGRKRLIVIDGALSTVECIILLFANSFWMFGVAVFLSGIGKALSSGSQNALLYDSLLAENKQSDFEKILGRLSAIDFTGYMVAAVSGGILADLFGFEFNYIISSCSMVLAFLFSLSLKEPPIATDSKDELVTSLQYTKQAISLFKSKLLVLVYSLSGAVLGACLIYLDEFWQLILDAIGTPVLFFGAISVLIFSIRIPGNLLAYKLKKKFSYKLILTTNIIVTIIGYIAISLTRNIFCLIPMAVVFFAAGITDPLIMGYLHHQTESNIRATVESFTSLGLRFLSILVGIFFGYVSAQFSIFTGFAALAFVCFGCLIFFISIRKH